MIPTDALVLQDTGDEKLLRGIPDAQCFIMPEVNLEGFRFFEDSAGIYRGDWSVELGEQHEVLSLILDFYEHWGHGFAETMHEFRGVEVIHCDYLRRNISSAHDDVLEVRINLPHKDAALNAQYEAWPLSRFYSPSLDQMTTFILLDFWSLVRKKSTEPGTAPNGGPAAPSGNSGTMEGPPRVS